MCLLSGAAARTESKIALQITLVFSLRLCKVLPKGVQIWQGDISEIAFLWYLSQKKSINRETPAESSRDGGDTAGSMGVQKDAPGLEGERGSCGKISPSVF